MGGAASCSFSSPSGPLLKVAGVEEFGDAPSMKEVELPNKLGSILIVKTTKGFRAVGSKCTHYGAPLVKGAATDTRIRCPWHGACFNLETGDIEESPGIDGLPCFKTKIKDGNIYVYQPEEIPTSVMRPLTKMSKPGPTFVIVGAGTSALVCAQTLRQEKFNGRIIMIGQDKNYPYDRTKLSKAPESRWDDIKLRDANFYKDNDIETHLGKTVTTVNFQNRLVELEDGGPPIAFDKLVIASGVKPRQIAETVPGSNLKNIFCVYNISDANSIARLAENKNVVIIGSSFIAMEMATSLKGRARSINIVGRSKVPYGALLGPAVGKAILQKLLTSPDGNKIHYYGNDEPKSFDGNTEGEVRHVTTALKKTFDADVVVVAIGALPNTEFLPKAEIQLSKGDNAITVNKFLETSVGGVYAMGDVALFPTEYAMKGKASVCHWGIAQNHGRVAALNLLGKAGTIHKIVPFFWTSVAGTSIRYTGCGEGYSEVSIHGSIESMEFCVCYLKGKKLLAAATVGCDPLAVQIANELESGAGNKALPKCITDRFPKPATVG